MRPACSLRLSVHKANTLQHSCFAEGIPLLRDPTPSTSWECAPTRPPAEAPSLEAQCQGSMHMRHLSSAPPGLSAHACTLHLQVSIEMFATFISPAGACLVSCCLQMPVSSRMPKSTGAVRYPLDSHQAHMCGPSRGLLLRHSRGSLRPSSARHPAWVGTSPLAPFSFLLALISPAGACPKLRPNPPARS